ncbi:MAG: DMT family transporter [Hydrogenibacillus sp.]|nr:DMT family transporter [Hydrogenibacillus sp.]
MERKTAPNKRVGALAVLLAATFYGTLAPMVKRAYDDGLSFGQVTFGQLFWASVTLLFVRLLVVRRALRRTMPPDRSITAPRWVFPAYAAVGVLGLAGVSLFYYGALQTLPARVALILLFQFVWIGIFAERLFFGVPLSSRRVLSVALIVAGDVFALRAWEIDWFSQNGWGMLCGLMAAVSYTAFLLGTSRLPQALEVLDRSLLMVGSGALFALVFFLFSDPGAPLFTPVHGLGYVLWLAVLGQVLPPILFNWGAPKIGGSMTTLLSSVELPVGMVLAALLLGEPFGTSEAVGTALIVAGLVLSAERDAGASEDDPSPDAVR